MCTVVHVKDGYDVYIGRPGHGLSGPWGNPYSVKEYGRQCAIAKYETFVNINLINGTWSEEDLLELDGKRLGCFCAPKSCHGDVLVRIVQKIKMLKKFGVSYTDQLRKRL